MTVQTLSSENSLQTIERWVKDGAQKLLIGCVATGAVGAIGIYRLRQLYDTSEIVGMGVAIITVSACGRYAIVKMRKAVRESETPIQDFISMVRRWFMSSPQSIEVNGWVETMIADYKPGRTSYALPIGVNESGKIIEASMEESESHLIIQGASGYGKSYLVNQIVLGAALTGLYQVILVGKSIKDYAAVSKMNNVHAVRLREDDDKGNYPERLLNALNSTYMHLCKRQEMLEAKGVSTMGEIRKRDRPQSVLFVIDEFSNAVLSAENMSSKLSRQLQGRVTQIAQEGRAVNMHLLLVGQRAAAVIDKRVRAQMVSIVYRTKDANESYLATGSKEINAHELIVGDPKKGRPHQIAICDERRNRRAFVPATPPADFHRLASMDQSGVGEEPFWLTGYASPRRTNEVPVPVPMVAQVRTRVSVPVDEKNIGSKTEDMGDKIAQTTDTGTAGTVLTVRNWAGNLFDTHADYSTPPSRLTRDRVIEIALCGLIGLSENGTMRAVFNGNTKPEYRSDVKTVFLHMKEASFVVG